ncbi:MAG TPA: TonB-dependent receptor [Rudaea sp.]|nr:TonB-dependent receptor [Rudaea sp.]
MKHRNLIRLALTSAILAALPQVVWADADAEQAPPPTPAGNEARPAVNKDTQSLEGIVVTGTATSVRKLDASYSITAANLEQIKMANPKATADILKISPGIWPESSGGQTGANIEIAGFPGGGDAPFFTNMVQGSPLYGMSSLSFMDSSSLLRLDDTIDRVEIVQTGPGVLYGAGQMGATANFILRQGSSEPHGDIGVTYGDEGLLRVDGFYGFKIADGWYGSIGGFWRESDGVRDPQFKSDSGGQLTATLTHDLDNGSFMLWARRLDDKNQFIVPTPFIEDSSGNFSKYPGFDGLTDSYGSHAIQHVNIVNPAGGTENADLANGRGGQLNYFGGNYDAEFNGWTVSDRFLWDSGDLDTNALFSGPNPKPLGYFLYGCKVPSGQNSGFCDSNNHPIDGNWLNDYGLGNLPVGSVNYSGGGSLDQSVIQQGWWWIQKHLKNLNNDFRLSKEIFDGNTLTGGVYLAHYTDEDNWSLGNPMLMTNTPNATPITLSYVDGGVTKYITNPQGILGYGKGFNILEHGTGDNKAFYLADSWRWNNWLFDIGGRIENIDVDQYTCNQKNVNLDGDPNTLWDNTAQICDGTFTHLNYDKTHPSFTIGANYDIADNMSAYVRGSTGGHFNDFDNGIRGTGGNFSPMQKIHNFEYGWKWQSEWAFIDVTGYHRQFTGLTNSRTSSTAVPLDCNGDPTSESGLPQCTYIYGADTKGVNFHGLFTWTNFKVDTLVAWQDGHYSHAASAIPYTDVNGNTLYADYNGKPLQRQPKLRWYVTPSYNFAFDWGNILPFVTYTHVGQRYEDQTGLAPLGEYDTWDFGVVANYGPNWEFRLQGTNLSNEIGLTEGNARVAGVPTGPGGILLARSIEGREINFQVRFKF